VKYYCILKEVRKSGEDIGSVGRLERWMGRQRKKIERRKREGRI